MCRECGCGNMDEGLDDHNHVHGDESHNNTNNNHTHQGEHDHHDGHTHTPEDHAHNSVHVVLNRSVNEVNDLIARAIAHNLEHKGVMCINIMGAPGSGKTTFIEGIASIIGPENIAVIQGDLESDIDKKRLERSGVETCQINTHSGCHLNAIMINKALLELNFSGKKFLLIENVGNLVCPAGVKLGQHMNIVISSTTEGSDKPAKYPVIFMDSDLIIISKYDLKDAVDFDEAQYVQSIKNINGRANIIALSRKDSESFKKAAAHIVHAREHLLGIGHHH